MELRTLMPLTLFPDGSQSERALGVELVSSTLQSPGANIQPFDGEAFKPFMDCSKWAAAFRSCPILGWELVEAMFMVAFYTYPYRGDNLDKRISRSQSIVTRWHRPVGGNEHYRLLVFFPVYDGIGYWIAKRRREGGMNYYTLEHETALARVSAMGALGMASDHWRTEAAGTQVCRCIWAPDPRHRKVRSKPGILAVALRSLGLEERKISETDDSDMKISHYQLYGDCYALQEGGRRSRLPFDCSVPLALRSGWNMVRAVRGSLEPPSKESY